MEKKVIVIIIIVILLAVGGYFIFTNFSKIKEIGLEFGESPDVSSAYKPAEAIEKSTDIGFAKTNPFEE